MRSRPASASVIWVPMPTMLQDGRDQEGEEHGEGDEAAEGQGAGEDLAGADEHDQGAYDAHQHGGREAHEGDGGERGDDVVEQALDAGGEDGRLRALRRDSP